jgi:hypothetical protein
MLVQESTIRFEGSSFYMGSWMRGLKNRGFQHRGGIHQTAVYGVTGNNIIIEHHGFVTLNEVQGYEVKIILQQTRRWEGIIKFYAILFEAFDVPPKVTIIVGDKSFTNLQSLRIFAETAILQDFDIEDLINYGVYQPDHGIHFT